MDERQERQRRYLEAMGITLWVRRDHPLGGLRPPPQPTESPDLETGFAPLSASEPKDVSRQRALEARSESRGDVGSPESRWDELRGLVRSCTHCAELAANRTQTVFGVGDPAADWMIIGEAPGADEDRQGEPFVGRAGQLLNAMLLAAGLRRPQVYIANILKCRPPNNRDPKPEEAAACEGYLRRQIALVRPKLILVVGRVAAQRLLDSTAPIGRLRGKVHRFDDTPVVVTYHPAYLLRSPAEKRKAWDDLRLALSVDRQNP